MKRKEKVFGQLCAVDYDLFRSVHDYKVFVKYVNTCGPCGLNRSGFLDSLPKKDLSLATSAFKHFEAKGLIETVNRKTRLTDAGKRIRVPEISLRRMRRR